MVTKEEFSKDNIVYSKEGLGFYDFFVHNISSKYFWKCDTKDLVKLYRENTSRNHLDVGVASDLFLRQFDYDNGRRLALMDINQGCLDKAKKSFENCTVETYNHNILETLPFDIMPFDSVSINYVLHCLPGDMNYKKRAFENIKGILNKDGVVFGATLTQDDYKNIPAMTLMRAYNENKIFNNLQDYKSGLEEILNETFTSVDVRQEGCAAIFVAKK